MDLGKVLRFKDINDVVFVLQKLKCLEKEENHCNPV